MAVTIKFTKLFPEAQIPQRQSDGAAGFDLHITEPVVVPVSGSVVARTGISMHIPSGYVGILKDRSGEAVKHGIHVLAGVIDSDYRGEVKVVLHNLGELPRHYETGDRVAQMVVFEYLGQAVEATGLDSTGRGSNGFGSTGL